MGISIGPAPSTMAPTGVRRLRLLVAVVLTGLVAACGDATSEKQARSEVMETETTAKPPTTSETEGAPLTTSTGEVRLQGRALAKSDVSGLADGPINSGAVLFVPDARAAELFSAAGLDPGDAAGARHASVEIEASKLASLEGSAATLDTRGAFTVDVRTGGHLVCLADSFPDHTQGPPYSVVGCGRVELLEGRSLTVSFGEGGVEVAVE